MSRYSQPTKTLLCTVEIKAETEKAFLFMQVEKDEETGRYMDVREAWFPKSQVAFTTDCHVADDNDVYEVEIQLWIAQQKEFDKPAPTETAKQKKYAGVKTSAPDYDDDIPF